MNIKLENTPIDRVFDEKPTEQLLGFGSELAGVADFSAHDQFEEFLMIFGVEWEAAAHHFVHHNAHSPPVNGTTVVVILEDLKDKIK